MRVSLFILIALAIGPGTAAVAQVDVKNDIRDRLGGLGTSETGAELRAESLRRQAELRSRVSELRQRLDKLELEMDSVRRELTKVQKQLAANAPASKPDKSDDADPPDESETVATTQPADDADPDADKKDDGSDDEKDTPIYRSMVRLMSGMPREARPSGLDGWNIFSVAAARDWLNKNRGGDRIAMRSTVSSVDVKRNDSAVDAALKRGEWIVTLQLESDLFRYLGTVNSLNLVPAGEDQGFVFKVDESFARKASRLEKGSIVILEGRIKSVDVEGKGKKATVTIRVEDYGLSGY